METLKSRRAWTDGLQTLKDHRCQPRILYPTKLLTTIDEENKPFHDTKFQQYLPYLTFQKVLEGNLQLKELNHTQEKKQNK